MHALENKVEIESVSYSELWKWVSHHMPIGIVLVCVTINRIDTNIK
jgi:hypothetical protein